jgi:hypothetical protein
MDGLSVYSVPQGTSWTSIYVSVQEQKVAVQLFLHGELDVGMDIIEMGKEFTQLFQSTRLDYKCAIHVMETSGLVGHPPKCHLLIVFLEEAGNDNVIFVSQLQLSLSFHRTFH